MDIHLEKLSLIEKLIKTNKESLILRLKQIYKEEESDFWNELSKAEKESIERGLKDLERGKKVPYEDIKKEYKKWL